MRSAFVTFVIQIPKFWTLVFWDRHRVELIPGIKDPLLEREFSASGTVDSFAEAAIQNRCLSQRLLECPDPSYILLYALPW